MKSMMIMLVVFSFATVTLVNVDHADAKKRSVASKSTKAKGKKHKKH